MKYPANIGKSQKVLLIFVFFATGLMYSILNLTLLYGVHSPYILGVLNLSVFSIVILLTIGSLINGEFGKLRAPIYCLVLYTIMVMIVLALYKPADQGMIKYDGGLGWISNFYFLMAYAIAPTLMYLAPRARFMFIVKNSWIIYVPALITVLIIIFFMGDLGLEVVAGLSSPDVGRSTTKAPMGVLFVISMCWVVLGKSIFKMLFGLVGAFIAVYAIRSSSSQSLLISSLLAFITLGFLSLKNKFSLLKSVVLTIALIVGLGYFVVDNVAFERLSNIFYVEDFYMFGGKYDVSRLEFAKQGMDLFLSSPICGGNAYLPMGTYTHFYLVDILMATGLIGAFLCVVVYFGMFKGFMYGLSHLKTEYLWIIPFAVFYMSQFFFHGSLISIIYIPTGIFLALYLMRENNIPPCPSVS